MTAEKKISFVDSEIDKYKKWVGWTKKEVLKALGISSSTYYGWQHCRNEKKEGRNELSVLPEEKQKVIDYALIHTSQRHRELAYRMIDEDVAYLSPSSVYRILHEADLVCRWVPRAKDPELKAKPEKANERWQSDIQYVKVGNKKYYLLLFIDEYSRKIVHHALLREMTGDVVSLEAQTAIEKVKDQKPIIQTDNGSCFISNDFKRVLSYCGVGHHRIRPHCPEENGVVERANRTIGDEIRSHDLKDYEESQKRINGIIEWYNTKRLHSAIGYVTPQDRHTGRDVIIQKVREKKLVKGRENRIKQNMNLRKSGHLKQSAVKSEQMTA